MMISLASANILDIARCLGCSSPLGGRRECSNCGRTYRVAGNILEAIGDLDGNNRIAASFYDGQGWIKFRFWEQLFLRAVGGIPSARREIHQYLPTGMSTQILEVGIGDGENIPYLPENSILFGVDVSRVQLENCQARFPSLSGRLAWAEGEHLPFPDGTFDASYSIGGFNYFSDPDACMGEMRRVTKAGGPVIVADERPDLKRFGLGHLLGWKAYDAWWMRRVGLPNDFVEMVMNTQLDLPRLIRETCPDAMRVAIWKKLGYCLVDPAPSRRIFP